MNLCWWSQTRIHYATPTKAETDPNDVRAARELDSKAYGGVDEKIVYAFNKTLVDIFKHAVVDWLSKGMPLEYLKDQLLLRINKEISMNYKKRTEGYVPLNDCLYIVKKEIYFS